MIVVERYLIDVLYVVVTVLKLLKVVMRVGVMKVVVVVKMISFVFCFCFVLKKIELRMGRTMMSMK
jgi:hypothetical protein